MNGIGVTTQAYHMSIIVTIDFVSWIFLSSDRVDRMYNKSTLESCFFKGRAAIFLGRTFFGFIAC